jgi:hypothetical protein
MGVLTALCHPIGGKKAANAVRGQGGVVGDRSDGERLRPFGVVLDDLVAIQGSPEHGAVFEDGRVRVGDIQNAVLERLPVREVRLADAPLRGVPASEMRVVGCQLADSGFALTFDEARKPRRACADVGESDSVVHI